MVCGCEDGRDTVLALPTGEGSFIPLAIYTLWENGMLETRTRNKGRWEGDPIAAFGFDSVLAGC